MAKSDPLKNHIVTVGRRGNGAHFNWCYMGFMKLVYRILGILYVLCFFAYFAFRAMYSLGNKHLPYRIFVLAIEFLASFSVCFVVFMKIRNPWENQYVGQVDGAAHLSKGIQKQKERAAKMGKEATSRRDSAGGELFTPTFDQYGRVNEDESELSKRTSFRTEVHDVITLEREVLPEKAEFRVRVLVPCYKEDIGIVKTTLLAAVNQA